MLDNIMEEVYQIETEFDVEDICYDGIKLWPYIRCELFALRNEGQNTYFAGNSSVSLYKAISRACLAFKRIAASQRQSLKRHYEAVLFTDTLETRSINGQYIDKIANNIVKKYDNNLLVILEEKARKERAFSKYIPSDYNNAFIRIFTRMVKVDEHKLQGREVFEQVINRLGVKYDLLSNIRLIIAAQKYYSKLWIKITPQLVFVNCYYGDVRKMAAVQAANAQNIPTIELQHGIISSDHYAYVSFKPIQNSSYPKYLLTYGDIYKKYISSAIYDQNRIFEVGSFYIDHMRSEHSRASQEVKKKLGQDAWGKIIIVIAGQEPFDRSTLDFVQKMMNLDDRLFFVFVPRIIHDFHFEYKSKRFVVETDLDIYKCMCAANILLTVTSTTALEALALGVSVLLYNLDNLASKIIYPMISDCDKVAITDKPEDAVSKVVDLISNTHQEESLADELFEHGHDDLLKDAIQSILCESNNIKENKT